MLEPDVNYGVILNPSWLTTCSAPANAKLSTGVYPSFGTSAVAPLITGNVAGTSNQSPIKVTTALAHGLYTGQTVTCAGTGDANANTTALITVLDPFNFTLTGTTADGGAGSGGTWTLQNAISNITFGSIFTSIIVTTAHNHGLPIASPVTIASVGGTTEANGFWVADVLSANSFMLRASSNHGNAYTSGGTWAPGPSIDLIMVR